MIEIPTVFLFTGPGAEEPFPRAIADALNTSDAAMVTVDTESAHHVLVWCEGKTRPWNKDSFFSQRPPSAAARKIFLHGENFSCSQATNDLYRDLIFATQFSARVLAPAGAAGARRHAAVPIMCVFGSPVGSIISDEAAEKAAAACPPVVFAAAASSGLCDAVVAAGGVASENGPAAAAAICRTMAEVSAAAASAAVPILALPLSADIASLAGGETPIFFAHDADDSLAAAIKNLLSSRKLLGRLQLQAHKWAKNELLRPAFARGFLKTISQPNVSTTNHSKDGAGEK